MKIVRRKAAFIAMSLGALIFYTATARAVTDCSSVTNIGGNLDLTDDYITTSSTNTCLNITAAGAVLDCKDHYITCNNASGCGTAVAVAQNGITVKNCRIVSATAGNWAFGVNSLSGGVAKTTRVFSNTIKDSNIGVLLGDHIDKNVISGAASACIGSLVYPAVVNFLAGAEIDNNFCSTAGIGMLIGGPSSGTPMNIHENYVRAASYGIYQGGLTDFDKNIIDGAPSLGVSTPGTATFTDNLCDDTTYCNDPNLAPFNMTLTIH